MDPSTAWGLPWELEVPRQPHGWDWSRDGSHMAPHSTSTFYPSLPPVPLLLTGDWREEGCELKSDVLTQPFKQPSALSIAPPGRVKWVCPLLPLALSGPPNLSTLLPSPCCRGFPFLCNHQLPPQWFGEEMEVDVCFKSIL